MWDLKPPSKNPETTRSLEGNSSFWQGPWGSEQEVVRTDFQFHCWASGVSAQHVGPCWVWNLVKGVTALWKLWVFLSNEVRIREFLRFCYADFLYTGRFGRGTYMYFGQNKWYDLQATSMGPCAKVPGEAGKAVSILDVTWPQMQVSCRGDWWSSKNFTATSSNSWGAKHSYFQSPSKKYVPPILTETTTGINACWFPVRTEESANYRLLFVALIILCFHMFSHFSFFIDETYFNIYTIYVYKYIYIYIQ